jgi:osmotically-inducible protein OsmY
MKSTRSVNQRIKQKIKQRIGLLRCAISALLLAHVLSGCAALVVGGAFLGGSLLLTDRRSSGTQLEDQGIEFKANPRVREVLEGKGHINITSFNRLVLITGEVPTQADKAALEKAIASIDNVRSVFNEASVLSPTQAGSRSNDAFITSKVKATLFESPQLSANAFKVVTERGTVYLMGRVTEREATQATDLIRTISGVNKVVSAVELITEAELAEMLPKRQNKSAEQGPSTNF